MADVLAIDFSAFPAGRWGRVDTYENRGVPTREYELFYAEGSVDGADDGLYMNGNTSGDPNTYADTDWVRPIVIGGLEDGSVTINSLADSAKVIFEINDGVTTVNDVDTIVFDGTDFTITDDTNGQITVEINPTSTFNTIAINSITDVDPTTTMEFQTNFSLSESPAGTAQVFWRGMLAGLDTATVNNARGILFDNDDFTFSQTAMTDGEAGLQITVRSHNQINEVNDGTTTVNDVRTIVFDGSDFVVTDDGSAQITVTAIVGGTDEQIGTVQDGTTTVNDVNDILFQAANFDVVDLGGGAIRVDYVGTGGTITEISDGTTTVNDVDNILFQAANFDVVDLGGGDIRIDYVGATGTLTEVSDGTTTVNDVDNILFQASNFDVVDLGSGDIRIDFIGAGGTFNLTVDDTVTTVANVDTITFNASDFDVVDLGGGAIRIDAVGGGGGGLDVEADSSGGGTGPFTATNLRLISDAGLSPNTRVIDNGGGFIDMYYENNRIQTVEDTGSNSINDVNFLQFEEDYFSVTDNSFGSDVFATIGSKFFVGTTGFGPIADPAPGLLFDDGDGFSVSTDGNGNAVVNFAGGGGGGGGAMAVLFAIEGFTNFWNEFDGMADLEPNFVQYDPQGVVGAAFGNGLHYLPKAGWYKVDITMSLGVNNYNGWTRMEGDYSINGSPFAGGCCAWEFNWDGSQTSTYQTFHWMFVVEATADNDVLSVQMGNAQGDDVSMSGFADHMVVTRIDDSDITFVSPGGP